MKAGVLQLGHRNPLRIKMQFYDDGGKRPCDVVIVADDVTFKRGDQSGVVWRMFSCPLVLTLNAEAHESAKPQDDSERALDEARVIFVDGAQNQVDGALVRICLPLCGGHGRVLVAVCQLMMKERNNGDEA